MIDALLKQLRVPVGIRRGGLRHGRSPYLALHGADSGRACADLPRLIEPALVLRGLPCDTCFTRALQVCVLQLARRRDGAPRVVGDFPQLRHVELCAVVGRIDQPALADAGRDELGQALGARVDLPSLDLLAQPRGTLGRQYARLRRLAKKGRCAVRLVALEGGRDAYLDKLRFRGLELRIGRLDELETCERRRRLVVALLGHGGLQAPFEQATDACQALERLAVVRFLRQRGAVVEERVVLFRIRVAAIAKRNPRLVEQFVDRGLHECLLRRGRAWSCLRRHRGRGGFRRGHHRCRRLVGHGRCCGLLDGRRRRSRAGSLAAPQDDPCGGGCNQYDGNDTADDQRTRRTAARRRAGLGPRVCREVRGRHGPRRPHGWPVRRRIQTEGLRRLLRPCGDVSARQRLFPCAFEHRCSLGRFQGDRQHGKRRGTLDRLCDRARLIRGREDHDHAEPVCRLQLVDDLARFLVLAGIDHDHAGVRSLDELARSRDRVRVPDRRLAVQRLPELLEQLVALRHGDELHPRRSICAGV